MSADLPDTHASAVAMARCLASYIADPDKIQRRVLAEFGSSPACETIAAMRAYHLRPPTPVEPWKPHDGYYPLDASKAAAAASALFLARIAAERAASLLEVTEHG